MDTTSRRQVIDFHTHAWPDALAHRAVPHLEEEGDITAVLDGTIADLLRSMDAAGIEKAVVASIATKPEQFNGILSWSEGFASDRLLPFPSIHPTDPDVRGKMEQVAQKGFRGIKLHPYYQDFDLDEPRVFPLYEAADDLGLIVLMHTGFDMAFERIRRCDPVRIVNVHRHFPDLKFVATHMGAWEDWDEVRRYLLGRPIFTDVSYSVQFMPPETARELLLQHPVDYLIFGTDSPWAGHKETLDYLYSLDMPDDWYDAVLYENAVRLLRSV